MPQTLGSAKALANCAQSIKLKVFRAYHNYYLACMHYCIRGFFVFAFGVFVEGSYCCMPEVAPDWLACFPSSALRWFFDEFFKQAPALEVLLILVPSIALDHKTGEDLDGGLDSDSAVSAQAKRSTIFHLAFFEQSFVRASRVGLVLNLIYCTLM